MSDFDILVTPSPLKESVEGEKALFRAIGAPVRLNVDALRDNLQRFLEAMNQLMSKIPAIGEPYQLEEIELAVEINAEGNFQLIGGAKAGVTGGLTLTLKRKTELPPPRG